MAKLNFQQSLLQSSVSHDPSEIILICWFDAQLYIISNVKKNFAKYFVRIYVKNLLLGFIDK